MDLIVPSFMKRRKMVTSFTNKLLVATIKFTMKARPWTEVMRKYWPDLVIILGLFLLGFLFLESFFAVRRTRGMTRLALPLQ